MEIGKIASPNLHWRRSHKGVAGLPYPKALIRSEEEQFVVFDRAAHGAAELIFTKWRDRVADCVTEEEIGIQCTVLQIVVGLSMERVGAAFGDHVDRRHAVSKFRIHARHVDLEFFNRRWRLLRSGLTIDGALDVDAV